MTSTSNQTPDAGHAGTASPRKVILRWFLRGLLVLILLFVIAAGFETYRVAGAIMSVTGQTVQRAPTEPKITTLPTLSGTKRINILLLGTDDDTKPGNRQTLNTDTMMVVTIDPLRRTAGTLSIPRDLWVDIPGYGYNKINAAYTFGGIQLARETVERTLGITIDYYAWIGLRGFVKVVDTLGGVIVNAVHPVLDDTYPDDLTSQDPYAYMRVYIPAGPQYMNGNTALEYVRSRHGDLIGDFGRGARQEQVMVALRSKITTLNVLMNLPALASDLHGALKTDLDIQELVRMATFARSINPDSVRRVVLSPPRYTSVGWAGDQSVVYP